MLISHRASTFTNMVTRILQEFIYVKFWQCQLFICNFWSIYVFLTTYNILSLLIEDMSITLKLSRWDSYYKLFETFDLFFIRCDDSYYILLSSSYNLIITKTAILILHIELKPKYKLTNPCPTCSHTRNRWLTQAYSFGEHIAYHKCPTFYIHSLSSVSEFFL
jgi:hypothetical protein